MSEKQEDEVVDVSGLSDAEKSQFCLAACPTTVDGHKCSGSCGKRKVHPGRHMCFAGHSW